MKNFVIDGFEVVGNSSEDGRGPSYHVAYASKLSVAQDIAIGKGPMGSVGTVNKISKTIKVFDSFLEYQNDLIEQVKENALKKLTTEEKKALGLEI
jgi:hypothetical protein